ncbi:MAG TPA: histidine phosphatase family protein [Gemmataceae bacterium]|nr:histidine phosphatase family protein [Gemmataceae bacterium]
MPTRVFVLRHGESADPTVFHGAESDVGLSERGRRQAEAVAPLLAAYAPDAVVSSAMRRALDTAAPTAAACGRPVLVEPRLHERRVGSLSGTPFAAADGVWPATLRRWAAGETSYAPPGAESFDDIRGRVLPAWERLTRDHEGRCLVVVAHGVVCKVLFLSLLPGFSPADWERLGPIRNAALTELAGSAGRWRARRVNELPEEVARLEKVR